ncbi:MAG: response regulator, partial [Tunicatimonas sp.]|uniref:ATP-binding response regulator n=1 Tax=Tunicatimonas sp. TaxID=1940096 RepID=UPI003C76283C
MVVYLKRLNQEKEAQLAEEKNKALRDKRTIEEQAGQLNELQEFKDSVFIDISHEIRTPLTLIRGYIQRLSKDNGREFNLDSIQEIDEQAANIQQLADNILDLSKMDKQQVQLNKSSVNLTRLMSKIYSEFYDIFASKGIDFQLQLPAQKVVAYCDPLLMTRAISNLVTNALKFTPSGGIAQLNMLQADNCQIVVYNTGTGIVPEDLDKIFNRYYQTGHHNARYQGSGIGLSLVKGIVATHDFDIQVKSQYGAYTQFTITIPTEFVKAVSVSTHKHQIKTEQRKQRYHHEDSPIACILLVEDNEAMRKYIAGIESLADYQILQVNHGSEALDIVKKKKVDLIITDYMMPVMDGPELIRQLQNLGFRQPILLLTARTDQQSKLNMLRLGVDTYLTKPFLEEELLHAVRRALEYDQARQHYLQQIAEEGSPPLEADELLAFNQRLTHLIDENISNEQFDITDICEHLHLTERTLYRKV